MAYARFAKNHALLAKEQQALARAALMSITCSVPTLAYSIAQPSTSSMMQTQPAFTKAWFALISLN